MQNHGIIDAYLNNRFPSVVSWGESERDLMFVTNT